MKVISPSQKSIKEKIRYPLTDEKCNNYLLHIKCNRHQGPLRLIKILDSKRSFDKKSGQTKASNITRRFQEGSRNRSIGFSIGVLIIATVIIRSCSASENRFNSTIPPTSSVIFDWSPMTLETLVRQSARQNHFNEMPIVRVILEYSPPKGQPHSPVLMRRKDKFVVLNGTWPAVGYQMELVALFSNGTRHLLLSKLIYSSPEKPTILSMETSSTVLNLTYAEPKSPYSAPSSTSKAYTFYLEYFRISAPPRLNSAPVPRHIAGNHVFYVNTNVTTLRIRNLVPDSVYLLRIFSVFFGVRSMEATEIIFYTKPYDYNSNAKSLSPPVETTELPNQPKIPHNSLPTDLPAINNIKESITKPKREGISYSYVTVVIPAETTISPQPESTVVSELKTSAVNFLTRKSTTPFPLLEPTLNGTKEDIFSKEKITFSTSSFAVTTSSPTINISKEYVKEQEANAVFENHTITPSTTIRMNITSTVASELTKSTRIAPTDSRQEGEKSLEDEETSNEIAKWPENSEQQPNEESEATSEPLTVLENNKTSQSAIKLSLQPSVGHSKQSQQMRVDWMAPEWVICDYFMLNYTVDFSSRDNHTTPLSKVIGEIRESFALIDFYNEAQLELTVLCIFEGVTSSSWRAHRLVSLSRPQPVENLRVKEMFTDVYYVSSVILDFDWPDDSEPGYKVVISWSLGKKVVGKNLLEVVLPAHSINISGLEPAQLYTFTAVNASTELGLTSTTVGLRQITPPVITSTLYPGQLSSTAININFGDSDFEHPFDFYELVFSGKGVKNVTKHLKKSDTKSLNFNNLVPGKTYCFFLHTVYKRIRSRPVILEITTYPMKVPKFFPVLGPEYVTLYWDVDNPSENECRFRLDYSSTSNSGLRKSQTVNLNGTARHYRFNGLDYNTFYTFTIIVIMGKESAEAESESETANIGFMSKPKSIPSLKRYGSRELAVTFENDHNIFADTNGVIESFAVIVSEDIELGGDDFELKSWYDVHEEEVWPAYRASLSTYNPFLRRGSSRVATFIIGDEDCGRRKLHEPFCNGPLRAHTDYFVKIRAYSISNVAMETEWVDIRGVYVDESENDSDSTSQRRLPCHMYLNGCNNYAATPKFPVFFNVFFASLISLIPYLFNF